MEALLAFYIIYNSIHCSVYALCLICASCRCTHCTRSCIARSIVWLADSVQLIPPKTYVGGRLHGASKKPDYVICKWRQCARRLRTSSLRRLRGRGGIGEGQEGMIRRTLTDNRVKVKDTNRLHIHTSTYPYLQRVHGLISESRGSFLMTSSLPIGYRFSELRTPPWTPQILVQCTYDACPCTLDLFIHDLRPARHIQDYRTIPKHATNIWQGRN